MSYQKFNSHHTSSKAVSYLTLICVLTISSCSQETSEQSNSKQGEQGSSNTKPMHKEVGEASWYGPGLQGKQTANGETFNQKELTAAHPSLPMGTKAKVTNLENGNKVNVTINDRGPFAEDRVIDLSRAAAKKLDMEEDGTTQVKIETPSSKKKPD
ncbi:MAG: septal ring lytic transglycosylase RlpA family protein [Methylomicrobium sp.]|nr:septal ring lytic transglycosylase RlpA family protein [Methylomicrobium sp.]